VLRVDRILDDAAVKLPAVRMHVLVKIRNGSCGAVSLLTDAQVTLASRWWQHRRHVPVVGEEKHPEREPVSRHLLASVYAVICHHLDTAAWVKLVCSRGLHLQRFGLPASVAPSIFRDKNRRCIGKSQSKTTWCRAQRTPHLIREATVVLLDLGLHAGVYLAVPAPIRQVGDEVGDPERMSQGHRVRVSGNGVVDASSGLLAAPVCVGGGLAAAVASQYFLRSTDVT
jgi:hypothetical protein